MSENFELWGEPVLGDVYAVRTFIADGDMLASVSHTGPHWVEGVCEAVCLVDPSHVAPVEGCSCGVYAWWTPEQLIGQYEEFAKLMVAVIRMEGNVIEADNGVKAGKAQIVAWWVAEPFDEDEAKIIAGLVAACEASTPGARRYLSRDVMTGIYPPPTAEGRN